MAKTVYAQQMDRIQKHVQAELKSLGFRSQGRTFRRVLPSGFIYVINFQMGSYPVGEHAEIPGFRCNLYGQFTVNLGVFLPEVHEVLKPWRHPKLITEPDCDIRTRLGQAMDGKGDCWWSLAPEYAPKVQPHVADSLQNAGIPWLERFHTYEDVVREWEQHPEGAWWPARARLVIAIVLMQMGNLERAEQLVREDLVEGLRQHKPWVDFYRDVARRLGIDVSDLPSDIQG